MRLEACYYCSAPVYPGHGLKYIRNDAKSFIFCRHKCWTHFKVRHNPKRSRWTKVHRKLAGKELLVDPVFEFEKRRNEPVKYNRELYIKTVQAMKRLEQIRVRRAERFYAQRLRIAEEKQTSAASKLMKKHLSLINQSTSTKLRAKESYLSDATKEKMLKIQQAQQELEDKHMN